MNDGYKIIVNPHYIGTEKFEDIYMNILYDRIVDDLDRGLSFKFNANDDENTVTEMSLDNVTIDVHNSNVHGC